MRGILVLAASLALGLTADVLCAASAPRQAQPAGDRYARLAPFEVIEWRGDVVMARVGGRWGQVRSIDGLGIERILEFCRATWSPELVEKRFAEDLVEVMSRMGHPPEASVRVALEVDGAIELIEARMTEANRRALRLAGERGTLAPVSSIPRAQAEKAVREAGALLARVHSYSALLDEASRSAAIETAVGRLPERITATDLEAVVFSLIAPSGDGHAAVRTPGAPASGVFLPFLPIAAEDGGVLAVLPDRSGFVDAAFPAVRSIDGLDVTEWLKGAEGRVAAGSPQLVRDRACRELRDLGAVARLLGRREPRVGETLNIVLTSPAGVSRQARVELGARKPLYGEWPRRATTVIDRGGARLGYLRLAAMDGGDEFCNRVTWELDGFSDCEGLIIDVRGNGGGRRDVINVICPRLLAPDADPVVYNAARPLRLPDESDEEMDVRLASRFLYRLEDPRRTERERDAIRVFQKSFRPEENLPDDRFGAWYFATVAPAAPAVRRLNVRVVVLMDAGCFSATDVFLAAMREMPNVTLVGGASSGGSGLTRSHEVSIPGEGPDSPRCRLDLSLSSMVSFTPEGRLFDRRGIEPHVHVGAGPSYFIMGGEDAPLEAAIKRLLAE